MNTKVKGGRAKASVGINSRESALIKRARLGGQIGEQARSQLLRDHYPWIVQRCARVLSHHADASDAAQEVALAMHRALPHFEGRSSLRTWLSSIIHNECMNLIRRRTRNTLTSQLEAVIAIDAMEWPNLPVAAEQTRTAVHEVLKALPELDREVLHLRFFGELPIAEIGALLGISLSATKMRLYRALDTFRVACTESGFEPATEAF